MDSNNDKEKEPEFKLYKQNAGFTFYSQPDTWCIKINASGIFFNKEAFPNAMPDDFVNAFINILENSYKIKFLKEEKNEI